MVETTRVDFYILPDHQANGRALLACRLADKAYSQGHTVDLLAESEAQAAALDDLLWTFRQDSFIPHERTPVTGVGDSPVLIGVGLPPERKAQVLINCVSSEALPPGFERYDRVIELADQEPTVLATARARFRHYRSQGLMPETHKL